jgi:hypothetical protein
MPDFSTFSEILGHIKHLTEDFIMFQQLLGSKEIEWFLALNVFVIVWKELLK